MKKLLAALLLLGGVSLAQAQQRYDVDVQDATITAGTSCPSSFHGVILVRSTGIHWTCQAGAGPGGTYGWAEQQIAGTESVIDAGGANNGDALVFNSTTGLFEPETLPGGGDMLNSVVTAGGVAGIVDLAESLYANPAPCTGDNWVKDIAADGTLTCSIVPSDVTVRQAHTYADAGTGADGGEFTGWEDSIIADSVVVFGPGQYQVPDAGVAALPNNVRILCREGAIFEWEAVRTADTPMFTVPAGTDVEINGCSFQPGKTIDPVAGHSDGDGAYVMVGTADSQTPATVRLLGNTFGKGVIASGDLDWKQIWIQGAAHVTAQFNTFDFSNYGFFLIYGSDANPGWTVTTLVDHNTFNYSAPKSTADAWFALFGSSESGTRTNLVTVTGSFSDNLITGYSGRIVGLSAKLSDFLVQGNVVKSNNADVFFQNVVRDTANTAFSENVTVSGNICSGPDPALCNISLAEIVGATVSGNQIVMNSNSAAHNGIFIGTQQTGSPTSANVLVTGNTITYAQRVTADYTAMGTTRSTGVTFSNNTVIDGPRAGLSIGDLTSGTVPSEIRASGNTFINRTNDTDKLTLGAIRFQNNACSRCRFDNNVVFDVGGTTPMFTAASKLPVIYGSGNAGGADGQNVYRLRGLDRLRLDELVTIAKHPDQTGPNSACLGTDNPYDCCTGAGTGFCTGTAYEIELPKDAPALTGASSTLVHRPTVGDYFWSPQVMDETSWDYVFSAGAGADTSATTKDCTGPATTAAGCNASGGGMLALDHYLDTYSSTIVAQGASGDHTWTFSGGSEGGRVTAAWWPFGNGTAGNGSNCNNAVITFSYNLTPGGGGAYTVFGGPYTCFDKDCTNLGGSSTAPVVQYLQSPWFTGNMADLRVRVAVNSTGAVGSCAARIGTMGFQRGGAWQAVGNGVRIQRGDRRWPADFDFGRGVAEDVSMWFTAPDYLNRIAYNYEAAGNGTCFEIDQDATLGDGVQLRENTARVPTDLYMGAIGAGGASDLTIWFDGTKKLWWDDSPGEFRIETAPLFVGGAVTSSGAMKSTSFLVDATSAGGQFLTLYEDTDFGAHFWKLDLGATNLAASKTCTMQTDGRIPDDCVGDGTDGGGTAVSQGTTGNVQYASSVAGDFDAEAALTYDEGTNTLTAENISGVANLVVTGPVTLAASELDDLDGGIDESEVTGDVEDVWTDTAGGVDALVAAAGDSFSAAAADSSVPCVALTDCSAVTAEGRCCWDTDATGGVPALYMGDGTTAVLIDPFGTTVGPTELASTDFGSFTCNGTVCTHDTTVAGVGIGLSGDVLSFAPSEMTASFSIWDGTTPATAALTFNLNAGTDPVMTFGSSSVVMTNAAWDFSASSVSLRMPVGASPTVDATGEVATDNTDSQLVYYAGGTPAVRVLSPERDQCAVVENLTDTDDAFEFFMPGDAVTITKVGCRCRGTCSTLATLTLEIRDGTDMTITGTNPTCATTGAATYAAVTAGNAVAAGGGVAFNVTNVPSPLTDEYTICVQYTMDRQ